MIVLFVEDDRVLALQTIDFLALEGIEIDYADSVQQALYLGKTNEYDAVILDINLPDGNGVELAKEMLNLLPNTPIIFLTGQDNLNDKLAAFSAGALDYLTKPFELAELVIRLKLLSKKKQSHTALFCIADLTVNFSEKTIIRGQRVITLSPQQWRLLALLADASPAYVSKQKIIEQIWQDASDVTNDMYKSLLHRLRSNLTQKHEPSLIDIAKKQGVALKEPANV
ncbi:response regulator transcription factor [Flocculibacter collagenilyticus]|uniref:response regulator transcription factor n=1 Tax=Flocculibacter collagenilyticus TaxID=2744479 RepID=UPI0018F63F11|nr:response regulator transcription factor [Flocculibacter collagenilyticus]